MINLRTPDEIKRLFEAAQIVAEVHEGLRDLVKPGISTLELDQIAEDLILKRGAKPSFKGYNGFPFTSCMSLNEQIVHGFPSKKTILKVGDLISIDLGAVYKGWHGDAARSYVAGDIAGEAADLVRATHESLWKAIEVMVPGNHLGDIGHAVQSHVEPLGYSVVRDFVGHGIGRKLHEEPQVPNYGIPGRGVKLRPGMVLAVEPMINAGSYEVKILKDGWTAVTFDGKLSAHWEHDVAITENGPKVLSLLENNSAKQI